MARGYECYAHKHDSLVPLEDHHIHPLGLHGPDTAANRRKGCANAHGDTHYLLSRMLKLGGLPPWTELRTYGPGVRDIAALGFEKVMAYAAALSAEVESRM